MKQNNKIEKEFSAIILAAGKSERLGFPKLSLKYNENIIFLQNIVNEYEQFGCKEIIIVINEVGNKFLNENKIHFQDNVKIVINKYPEWHRFYSLKIGAKTLSEVSPVFIHNVDNPFVNHDVLNELLNCKDKADYIGPEFKGKGGHPILLSDIIVQELRSIHKDQIHIKEFLNQFPKMKVQVEDKIVLININTIEEYQRIFKF
ncbi:NTP transferase domain-containing protein [Bacteroidota bacterium]